MADNEQPDQEPSPSDLLNQSDIDALIAGASDGEGESYYNVRGELVKLAKGLTIEPYDFSNPVLLSEAELRRIRIRQEDFMKHLAARLSIFLRLEFGLKLNDFTTLNYDKFIETIPNPAHVTLFKVEPLQGIGIIDINPRLALALVDRLLGGKGKADDGERQLTEIEMNLMDDIVTIVLDEWRKQWPGEQPMLPVAIGHESSGRFLETSPSDAVMLVLSMEATLGGCIEAIQLAIPYYTIEPLVKRLSKEKSDESSSLSKVERQWKDSFDAIDIPVQAEWSLGSVRARETLALRPGDVLTLPKTILHETRIRLSGTVKFDGEVGLEKGCVAVKIINKREESEEI